MWERSRTHHSRTGAAPFTGGMRQRPDAPRSTMGATGQQALSTVKVEGSDQHGKVLAAAAFPRPALRRSALLHGPVGAEPAPTPFSSRADGTTKGPANQVIDAVARYEPVAGRMEACVDDAPHHALDPLGRNGGVELAALLPSPDLHDEDLVDRARDRGVRTGGVLPVEANRNSTRSPTWTMALTIRSITSSTEPEPGAASTIAAWRAAQESLVSADRRCSRSGK